MKKNATSKKVGLLFLLGSLFIVVAALWALDTHLHTKLDGVAGLNRQGLRGEVVGAKQKGELRVGVFGGSAAMSYGLHPSLALSSQIADKLQSSLGQGAVSKVTGINLANNNEVSLKYLASNYELFGDLDLDWSIFYSYHLGGTQEGFEQEWNQVAFSERSSNSAIRFLGYYPIFPQALVEKYLSLAYPSIEEGYKSGSPLLRLGHLFKIPEAFLSEKTYPLSNLITTHFRSSKKHLLIVMAPTPIAPDNKPRQEVFYQKLQNELQNEPQVHFLDLRDLFQTTSYAEQSLDGIHLNAPATRLVAEKIASSITAFSDTLLPQTR